NLAGDKRKSCSTPQPGLPAAGTNRSFRPACRKPKLRRIYIPGANKSGEKSARNHALPQFGVASRIRSSFGGSAGSTTSGFFRRRGLPTRTAISHAYGQAGERERGNCRFLRRSTLALLPPLSMRTTRNKRVHP